MQTSRLLELLAKQMGNAASDEELRELKELLDQNPDHQHLANALGDIQATSTMHHEETVVNDAWGKLQHQLQAPGFNKEEAIIVKRNFFSSWMGKAAIWAGTIIAAGAVYFMLNKPAAVQPTILANVQEITMPNGSPGKKVLPDGSVVWLNSGSNIRYAEDQEQKTRNVYLTGEAYFQVKHDAEHPFIVHAANISVRALGTEFNVAAYPDENRLETTLISGKVQVTMTEKPDQKIILAPHEKLTITNKEPQKDTASLNEISYRVEPVTSLPAVNAVPEVAWLQDKLAFQNEVFFKLAKRIERRYNVHIIFRDSTLKREILTGTFENENIQKALHLLQLTTPFRYKIERDSVFLNRN